MQQQTTTSVRPARLTRMALLTLLSAGITISEAAILGLPDSPMIQASSVEPNVLLTFDDSGSMARSFIPDDIVNEKHNKRACSSAFNRVYFDPAITYNPPVDANGQPLNSGANATRFDRAWINGYNLSAGSVDLRTAYRPSWDTDTDFGDARCGFTSGSATNLTTDVEDGGTNATARQAFYFTYNSACLPVTNNACYALVQHNNPAAGGAWAADRQQNFANWYSYYRNRNLTAKTSAGIAFARFGDNVRVAAQHLGENGTAFATQMEGASTGASTGTPGGPVFRYGFSRTNNPLRKFNGTARSDFFTRLYNSPAANWTPLRESMKRAGEYLKTQGPYLQEPTLTFNTTTNKDLSCRHNLHVMMTDGYWNGVNPGPAVGAVLGGAYGYGAVLANYDNAAFTIPTDESNPLQYGSVAGLTSYSPVFPYQDAHVGTLADLAFYYWITDLRSGQPAQDGTSPPALTNNVPSRLATSTNPYTAPVFWNADNDPAVWQHMTTYTIGLGISGTAGTTLGNWPDPCPGVVNPAGAACQTARVDDLWHAAVNSRGRFFNAQNPSDLVNAFNTIVSSVSSLTNSASSVAVNSGTLTSNNFLYQATFNSAENWSGHLKAFGIATNGTVNTTATWDAATRLNMQLDTARTILTYNPAIVPPATAPQRGVPFRWSDIDSSMQGYLNINPVTATTDTNGSARLDWIRGNASNEGTGTSNFRIRTRTCISCNTGWLGDLVDSAPTYVGVPPFAYRDDLEALPYSAYKNSKLTRTPVIYVGGNDGMLHGFDAASGNEVLGYVPRAVYPNLSQLTSRTYTHKYYVNGNQTVVDAYVGGRWRTILAGGLRKGGKAFYALDVSTPESFSEANAGNIVLWEFNNTHDNEMGYSFSEPVIARMNNGKWAVIFGNGYNNTDPAITPNSSTGNAVLYILFIEDGMDGTWSAGDFVKIDTRNFGGDGNDASMRPNGLGSPTAVDVDGDRIADFIYAGDLRGKMWRFDVRSSTGSNWNTAANVRHIFDAGTSQPITSKPTVDRHPASYNGNMVYFGTGKYLETSDATAAGATTQSFYGIWDDYTSGSGLVGLSSLVEQRITNVGNYRVITDYPVMWGINKGWYMNLIDTGERMVVNPLLYNGVIIFTTLIPNDDPCARGGSGWLMELNASNGGQLPSSPFDTDGDGDIDGLDLISGTPASGKRFGTIPSMPTIMSGGNPGAPGCANGNDCKYISGADGNIQTVSESKLDSTSNTGKLRSWRQVR